MPPGVNLKVDNLQTLYLAYSRSLTHHFELELAAGYPPLAKIEGRGPASLGSVPYRGEVISTARWIAPTLLLNYRFFDETTAVRPYVGVGVGVDYTTSDVRSNLVADTAGVIRRTRVDFGPQALEFLRGSAAIVQAGERRSRDRGYPDVRDPRHCAPRAQAGGPRL